jgi:YfiH family protein
MTGDPVRIDAPQFSDRNGIRAGFFTRDGGVSKGLYASLNCGMGSGDDRDAVIENRRRATENLGISADRMLTLYQVHSAEIVVVDAYASANQPIQKADAMVTRLTDLALGILTADCTPVLFADDAAGVIGAAHAGWRGAYSGIIGNTVRAMVKLGASVEGIRAAVGPCIGKDSYEVGPEFHDRFLEANHANSAHFAVAPRKNHYLFDLSSFVVESCRNTGILSVSSLECDSCADEDTFFSYRRATLRGEADYGRNLSAILLRSSS